jgi:hypothetical protein
MLQATVKKAHPHTSLIGNHRGVPLFKLWGKGLGCVDTHPEKAAQLHIGQ